MPSDRIRFAGDFGGLAALGLEDAEPLLHPEALLAGVVGPRAEVRRDAAGHVRARFPLPGTPDARGTMTGKPRGLGTGWVRLSTFDAPSWRAVWRARLSHPRSASLAEREWNLLCLLRAGGVGTPEPLVVGTRGGGPVARRSFVVVRELEGAVALPRWLRPAGLSGLPGERQRGLAALAATLANLARSGVLLPYLEPGHVRVSPSSSGDCEHDSADGPRKNRLPGISVEDVTGGRFGAPAHATRASLRRFLAALAGALSPDEIGRLERVLEPASAT